jgi:hypothetical protein
MGAPSRISRNMEAGGKEKLYSCELGFLVVARELWFSGFGKRVVLYLAGWESNE